MRQVYHQKLQRMVDAGLDVPRTRSTAQEANQLLALAEEAALEEWCLHMHRLGGTQCVRTFYAVWLLP